MTSVIVIHCQLMASSVKLLIFWWQSNRVRIYSHLFGKVLHVLQTSATVICQNGYIAGCGQLEWNVCFHLSSARWLHLILSCANAFCDSHLRLVDLSWQLHRLCSKTFSCGSSQVWGCGPCESNMYEHAIPDLGLALWAAWQGVWMQIQGKIAEQNEAPGTQSLCSSHL